MSHQFGKPMPAATDLPIRPGAPVRLSARVWRLTCANAGVMTGPGTNSYLVGVADEWTLIDPGPADADHLQALQALGTAPIRRILVTHTHPDHSPGAAALQQRTGAQLLGRSNTNARGQDPTFVPEHELADGERIALGPETALRVIHTPGHASNHLCYLLEPERWLFTGDHIIQGSTVLVDPPDGDMAHYLASLERLLCEDLAALAPGHGTVIARPHEALRALIAHRLWREARVLGVLRGGQPADLPALVAQVYVDVPAALHRFAERSLLAHLLKLQADGRAHQDQGYWSA
jgi:glyoxylase-like metal-dependent hydrolase (beta-lactamase superfamily II)